MSDLEVEWSPDGVEERPGQDSLVPYSTDEPRPSGLGRGLLIVLPLVIGLFVVAGIGARMLTAEVPERSATTNEQAPERCWDGELVPVNGCPVPTGRPGLRWVFPSFRPNDLSCHDATADFPQSTRPTMYLCDGSVATGPVTILYSQLTSINRGRASFVKAFGGEPEEIHDDFGRRLLWQETDDPGADGDYDLAVMYPNVPFAVEVTADSADGLDEALESLVKFRHADDIMTHS